MKRIVSLVFALFLLAGIVATLPAQKPAPQLASQNEQQTVYITKTGKKYHRAGCRYLTKSSSPISLKDAKARGYTACSVCKP